ncbi:MAG: GldG family protein [Planctomycetota bacterium]|jgi:ABC-type uncharacterized transport system involved in gliding motility auxiliary subunit
MNSRRQSGLSLWLVLLLVIPSVGLLQMCSVRFDLTEGRQYSLAKATVDTLGQLEDRLQVKLYFNRDIEGAEALLPQRLLLEDLLEEIAGAGGEWVEVETVDPTTDLAAMRDAEHVGVEPLQLAGQDIGGVQVQLQYQGLELRYQDRSEVIPFVTASEFEFAFTVRLASLLRPTRPVIGFVSDEPPLPPPMPGMPRQIPAGRIFEQMRERLGQRYAVRDLNLEMEGKVPEDIVAVVVARPTELAATKLEVLDRYLAEGGHMVVLQDFEAVASSSLDAHTMRTGLEDWLAGFGISTDPRLIYDLQGIRVQAGVQTIQTPSGPQVAPLEATYGFGLLLEEDSLSRDHVVTADLDRVASFWAHPIGTSDLLPSLRADVLLQSSPQSWLLPADSSLEMNLENIEGMTKKARQSGSPRPYALGVAVQGMFPPAWTHEDLQPGEGSLIVLGDADLFHNTTFASGGEGNGDFAANLLDWVAQDADLIALRSRGKRLRPLTDFAEDYVAANGGWDQPEEQLEDLHRDATRHARSRQRWISWGNVLGPAFLVLLLALGHVGFHRSRARHPFQGGGSSR